MTKTTSGEASPTAEGASDEETFVVETLQQVKVLTHPLRQRILEHFARRPRTTKQVADLLGEKPTRLYHHVAALEKASLIRLVETRPKRGTIEKYYSAVAKRFEIDPRAFASESAEITMRHPSVAMLESLFENTRIELAQLLETETIETIAREAVFMRVELHGDDELLALARSKIEALVEELEQLSSDQPEGARARRLLLGWYPLAQQ